MSHVKIAPHPNGAPPPEPRHGDVWVVRYRAAEGYVTTRLFWTLAPAEAWFDEVTAAGGLPVMHRAAALWQECGPGAVPTEVDRDDAA